MRAAHVVLDIPAQALDAAYTYTVPPDMDDAQVGCAVLVPFGGRQAVGFIVDVRAYPDDAAGLQAAARDSGVPLEKLKPIARVLSRSYFNDEGAACAAFLSERYLAPLSSCVRLFTPPGGVPRMVRANGYWRLEEPAVGEVDDRWVRLTEAAEDFKPRKGAIKQEAVLKALQAGELRVAELSLEYSGIGSVLKNLESKGVVKMESRRRLRGTQWAQPAAGADVAYAQVGFEPTAKPALTPGQADAVAAIQRACDSPEGRVVLVDGVTGSGKTEVYLQAIEHVLRRGQSAIVLVPEISLTPQTMARFRGRFGDMVAVLHSRMSDGERYDQWDFIRSGGAHVVVGARSALFAPVGNLGLIVIDEEHETSYKQDQAPRYVSRDVARWMVDRTGGALVLGSATPSIESLYAAKTDPAWERAVLPERANRAPMPRIEVVDMAREFGGGSRSMFSKKLAEALRDTLSKGQKAVLMLNQRGFASFLLCRSCGFVPTCPSCSTSLTYHERGSKLVCHHCGYTVPAPARCPVCGSPYLKRFGAGTQRVEAELSGILSEWGRAAGGAPSPTPSGTPRSTAPSTSMRSTSCAAPRQPFTEGKYAAPRVPEGAPPRGGDSAGTCGGMQGGPSGGTFPVRVIRMDADTTSRKGAHQRLLERFAAPGPAILLGTQMIAKGLDFDDVTLVGVVNADTQLRLPDFRAGERTFDLIEQVAGRAGRAGLPGRVIVQTYSAGAAPIQAAAHYDRAFFLRDELPKRKLLGYPPYVRLADVRIWGKSEEEVRGEADSLFEALSKHVGEQVVDSWTLFPASPCVLARLRGNFRYHIVMKAPAGTDIARIIAPVFRTRKTRKTVNVAVDIDPVSLL